jgi:hypothetical protein
MSDTMTVKELAEVAGVSPNTIRRAAKASGIESVNGVAQTFDHEQALNVIASIRVKASRKISPSQNGKVAFQNGKAPRQIAEVQPEIVKAFTEALQVMNKMADACLAMAAKVQSAPVIAPPEQEYSTISGYCRRNGIRVDLETAKRFGKIATAISNERGYPIRKISDERWGEVNAYHVSVLSQAVSA